MHDLLSHDKAENRFLALLVFVALCVIVGVCCMDILFCGDSFSDINVLTSGNNFAKYGFLKLHFLPVHQVGTPSETPAYYLHYPPLGNIFNGMLRKIGVDSIFIFRFVGGICSLIGVVCLYKVLTKFLGCLAAFCGLLFFITSRYFFEYSCSFHSHAYNIMYVGLFLLFFFRAIDNDKGRARYWIGCWIVLFLCSLTSFEFILFLSGFAGVYIIFSGRLKKHYLGLIVLATAPFLGVGLHFLQNCWAIGLDNTLADGFGFHSRDGGFVSGRFTSMSKLPYLFHDRTTDYFCFTWLAMLSIVGLCPLLLQKVKNNLNLGVMLWACLFATSSWFIFMPSHAFVHKHTLGQFMLLVIISTGLLLSALVQIVANRENGRTVSAFAMSIILVIAGVQFYTVSKRIYIHTHKYSTYKMFRDIGESLPADSGFLVNKQMAGPYVKYYSGSPVVTVSESFDLADRIEVLKSLTSDKFEDFYFVYGNEDEYMKDELFIKLASTCPGYRKDFKFANKNPVMPVFLFNLNPIINPDATILSNDRMSEQIEGHFPEWHIPKGNL